MEKHNEEYSVKSRFLRFAGQSVLRRGDYFMTKTKKEERLEWRRNARSRRALMARRQFKK
jgi:hypothetical protein